MNQHFIFVERDVQTHSLIKSYLKRLPILENPEAIKKRLEKRAARYLALKKVKHDFVSIFQPKAKNSNVCRESEVQFISFDEPAECAC